MVGRRVHAHEVEDSAVQLMAVWPEDVHIKVSKEDDGISPEVVCCCMDGVRQVALDSISLNITITLETGLEATRSRVFSRYVCGQETNATPSKAKGELHKGSMWADL